MRKLLLWDLDGTLLRGKIRGRTTVLAALSTVIDREAVTDGVLFGGRTDPAILRDVLLASGCSAAQTAELLPKAMEAYTKHAMNVLVEGTVAALAGGRGIIDALKSDDRFQLALLTGNVEPVGFQKLLAAGYDPSLFPFGAFGSDHEVRAELPAIAVRRALEHSSETFEGKDVVIIGDTPNDIQCGRSLNVRSVAIATGGFSSDELNAHQPDFLFDDLTDHEALIQSFLTEL